MFEEFLAEYPSADSYDLFHFEDEKHFLRFKSWGSDKVDVSVNLPTKPEIEYFFQSLERDLEKSVIKKESPPIKSEVEPFKSFIGHGHDQQWRDLKDHLHEQYGFDVVAYEIGPRAGLSVKEVLETMLNQSSIAFLVMTGEDVTTDGAVHARENVIHEVGLFQGRLGFKRSIVLLEKGVHEISNVLGIN